MTPEIIYFLKINLAVVLFYGFYRLFFYKDTFFHWRRVALLGFMFLSVVYPLCNLQEWIREQEPMVAIAELYASVILPEIAVTAPAANGPVNWLQLIPTSLLLIYIGGVIALLIRFIIQLASIIRLRIIARRQQLHDTDVFILNDSQGPFSFFRWIFIPENQLNSIEELSEIIIHEKAHARQWHSVDIIVGEMLSILCWFNPFVWLMKREIRNNLEFLADEKVLKAGHDSKSYQYHLLGLAYQTQNKGSIYNSFNILPLKKRIMMMNKKRTGKIGFAKYLLFVPLALLLLIISNIEAVARTAKNFTSEREIASAYETTETNDFMPAGTEKEEIVFEVVEQMPEYPGGTAALMKFLSQNIKYPVEAINNNIEGRVIVQFIVEKDGSIGNVQVVRSVHPDLDTEAARIIALMPAWRPGTQRGLPVRTKFTVPVLFRLQSPDNATAFTSSGRNSEPHDVVENMPEFPGGNAALMSFLSKNVKYPAEAEKAKIQGRVITQFIVSTNGEIRDAIIVKGVDPLLDNEALRVVNSMPNWKPGKEKGKSVDVKYTIPVNFKIPS